MLIIDKKFVLIRPRGCQDKRATGRNVCREFAYLYKSELSVSYRDANRHFSSERIFDILREA